MPGILEKEIEKALEGKLSKAAAPAASAAPAAPAVHTAPARRAAPVVRFSPMFSEPPATAKKKRRNLVAISIGVHVVLFLVIAFMPRQAETIVEPSLPLEIVFTAPVPAIPELRPPVARIEPPKPKPKPEKAKEPEPPKVAEIPKPEPKPVIPEVIAPPVVAKVEPPKPRAVVRTGLLDEAPSGPAIMASKNSRSVVLAGGFDGSTATVASAARPGRVAEVGFEGSAPAPQAKSGSRSGGVVQSSGFAEETAAVPKKRERERTALDLDSEVEILSKPKPIYTEEARELRIEGDVVLDVTFLASGVLRVLGVSQGLGHGLDEAAIVAAKKIQFIPAKRDAQAVDHTAKLRVVFRLA